MKKRIECRIEGRVQMVMYRDFTTRTARKLLLRGNVVNNKDGSVSVIAEGEEESLNAFIPKLNQGSLLSRVISVEVTWMDPTGELTEFTIVYEK